MHDFYIHAAFTGEVCLRRKIVFIIGSGRKNSFNKTLSQVAAKALEGKAEIEVVDALDVLLNQDEEFLLLKVFRRSGDAVMAADGVWLLPGVQLQHLWYR